MLMIAIFNFENGDHIVFQIQRMVARRTGGISLVFPGLLSGLRNGFVNFFNDFH